MTFILLHELGHMAIDQLDLPVVGPEEDAADEFATFLLLGIAEENPAAHAILVAAADAWRLMWALSGQELIANPASFPFWDEHNLDIKRSYNIVCLLYGSDPRAFWPIIDNSGMPVERARKCEQEYAEKQLHWHALLESHLLSERGWLARQLGGERGQLSLTYWYAPDQVFPRLSELTQKLMAANPWGGLVAFLNETLVLPRDVPIIGTECGMANAFYQPGGPRIVLCHEMVTMLEGLFHSKLAPPATTSPPSSDGRLLGSWVGTATGADGVATVVHYSFTPDGRFRATKAAPYFQLFSWGRHLATGDRLQLDLEGWEPHESCYDQGCLPIHVPTPQILPYAWLDADTIRLPSGDFRRSP